MIVHYVVEISRREEATPEGNGVQPRASKARTH